jgi:hypothetical protein
MRTGIYGRIVESAEVELIPAEAWLLGRIAIEGRIDGLGPPRSASPEEIALLTARLLERGYLTVDLERDRIELSETGLHAHERLVESGRAELRTLIADMHPPDDEVDGILRQIAASLLADIPAGARSAVTADVGFTAER